METKEGLQKKFKGISIGLVLTLGIFLLLFLVFIAITDEMVLEGENALDFKVFHFVDAYTNPATTQVMAFITFFGSSNFLLPAYLVLILFYLLYRKNTEASLNILSIGITSTALLFLLKDTFERHRPLDPLLKPAKGYSYPSGHTFCGFIFYGLLIYALWKANISKWLKWVLSVLLFLFAFLISVSRVYLHVHFASDVVAGFCLSIIWLPFSLWVLQKLKRTGKVTG